MKLQPDRIDAPVVAAIGQDWIEILHAGTRQTLQQSFLLNAWSGWSAWPVVHHKDLDAQAMSPILDMSPEVVILGTGLKTLPCPPPLLALLHARRTGLEAMAHRAACRTYNVLAQEGRHVVLAWIRPEVTPDQ